MNLQMQSYAHIHLQTVSGLSKAYVYGDLGLKQRGPLDA